MRTACAVALLAYLTIVCAPLRADAGLQSLAPVQRLTPAVREPIGVAVKEDGTIFVSDHTGGTILELLPDDRTRPVVAGLWKPWGVGVDGDGRLLIGEEYGRLLRLEADGTLTTLASRLYRPRWIAGDGRTVYTSVAGLRYPHTVLPGEEPPVGHVIIRRTPESLVVRVADGFVGAPAVVVTADALYAVGETIGTAAEPGTTLALRLPLGADDVASEPEVLARVPVHAPAGLAVDRLGSLFFVARSDPTTPSLSIFKLLTDGRLATFASGLSGGQGLALEPDGHMLVAVPGTAPGLLRFLAPDAPRVTAPAPAQAETTTITGTAEAGGLIAVHRSGDGREPVAVSGVDATGRFAVAVPLESNTLNTLELTVVGAHGDGLASQAAAVGIVHDDRPPAVSLGLATLVVLSGTVDLGAEAHDEGSALRALTLYADARVIELVETEEAAPSLRITARLDTLTLGDGTHTLGVVAEDHAGNTAADVRTAIVDNTPPETTIVAGPSGETTEAAPTFMLSGRDNLTPPEALRFAWRVDDGSWSPPSPATTIALAALGVGPHRFDARALDAAGNEATVVSRAFTVVTAAPSPLVVALSQIQTIRNAVTALVRAGECSWGTSCLGWASDGFHGIDILVGFGHLPPEYDGNISPWRSPYGVIGGVDGYAIKVHGLPPGPDGDAACRDLASALAAQARSTSCWGGWDQKVAEIGFHNP